MFADRVIKDFFSIQFFTFLITGGICAGINFFSRFYFQLFFTYVTSVSLGFVLGTFASFFLNRQYTFQACDGRIVAQMTKFGMLSIGAIFVGTTIAYICLKLYSVIIGNFLSIEVLESAAHATSIVVTAGYNFLAMKYFAFKRVAVIASTSALSNHLPQVPDKEGTHPSRETGGIER